MTDELLWVSAVVAVLATLLAQRDFPLVGAAALALVRVAVPLVYFAWFFDGTWTLLDDLSYFEDGSNLLRQGFNPLTALFTAEGYDELARICGGHHVLYSWWNLSAEYCFGEHYYAPVLLNVLLTFVTAGLLARTVALLGFSTGYQRMLQVFYLLHWETIAWSSFMNFKDVLVQLLTVAAFYCVTRFIYRRDWVSVLGFLTLMPLFYLIRFYLPVLILLATMLWIGWQWRDARKLFALPVVGLVGLYVALPLWQQVSELLDPRTLLYGGTRFLVTPLPWSVTDGYAFLQIPSLLHLAFLLPALAGLYGLWRGSPVARLYLIYFAMIIGLYAITEELQEPRHRYQIAFVFVWLQFHFFWMLKQVSQRSVRLAAAPVGAVLPRAPRPPRPTRPMQAWT